MADTAVNSLHEVLLQAALRAERANTDKAADERAREIARRLDERERKI